MQNVVQLKLVEPPPKKVRKKKEECTLAQYIQGCRERNEAVIPEGNRVFEYATEIELPREFLALAWWRFKDSYLSDNPGKKYKDWTIVFLKAVKENWMKVWYIEGDGFKLTTIGLQAQKSMQKQAARKMAND